MTTIVVLDVGDVLIRTHPDAHYRALAELLAIPMERVREAVEHSGLVARLERGECDEKQFTNELRALLTAPSLTDQEVAIAWCAVLGRLEPIVAAPARLLAAADRLVLASNTNAVHWRQVRSTLAQAGIKAPALLSHELGITKPDPRFFAALTQLMPPGTRCGIYVDDRADNIDAARAAGLPTCHHTDPRATAHRLAAFATDPPALRREAQD